MNRTAKPQHHGSGRDSHGARFERFKVNSVHRIESHRQWIEYVQQRERIVASGEADAEALDRFPELFAFVLGYATQATVSNFVESRHRQIRLNASGAAGHTVP